MVEVKMRSHWMVHIEQFILTGNWRNGHKKNTLENVRIQINLKLAPGQQTYT